MGIICCADGQCALVIENGKIIETFETPGEHIFHNESAPTIFGKSGIKGVMKDIWNRVGFGGDAPPVSQRVYYLNTRECHGISFSYEGRSTICLMDEERGLDVDCSISCSGMFSYRITEPVQFYKNISGNVVYGYTRSKLSNQIRQEFLSALCPTFSLLSEKRIRVSEFPAHTEEMSEAMRTVMSNRWICLRGIEVVTITFSFLNVTTYDGKILAEIQKAAALRNPLLQTAHLADAMEAITHDSFDSVIVHGCQALFCYSFNIFVFDNFDVTRYIICTMMACSEKRDLSINHCFSSNIKTEYAPSPFATKYSITYFPAEHTPAA